MLYHQELVLKQPTHVAQARKGVDPGLFVVYNATLLTMATGKVETDLLKDSVLVVDGGVIQSVYGVQEFDLETLGKQATVINAGGGVLYPYALHSCMSNAFCKDL